MKLISMTDFVLEQNNDLSLKNSFRQCINYAMFLKQPLTLGMFVPCDENGNILEIPLNYAKWKKRELNQKYYADLSLYEYYEKAEKKVIFKGFDINFINDNITHVSYKNNKKFFLIYGLKNENHKIKTFVNNFSEDINTIEDLVKFHLDCEINI